MAKSMASEVTRNVKDITSAAASSQGKVFELERALAIAEEEAALAKSMANEVTRNVKILLKQAEQKTMQERQQMQQRHAHVEADAGKKLAAVRAEHALVLKQYRAQEAKVAELQKSIVGVRAESVHHVSAWSSA